MEQKDPRPGRTPLFLLFLVALLAGVGGCGDLPFSAGDPLAGDPVSVEPDEEWYKSGLLWHLERINAPRAWRVVAEQEVLGRTSPVVLAVVDSAIDQDHEDLRDVISEAGAVFLGGEAASGPAPPHDHGSHVAGLAGALGGNGTGVVGASFNGYRRVLVPLLPVTVLSRQGDGTVADLAEGIYYAAGGRPGSWGHRPDRPAGVINLSLGIASLRGLSREALHGAVRFAAERDVVLVAAAGNNQLGGLSRVDYPARFPEVIAVGALDQGNNRAGFSHYGEDLELMAPGVQLTSTVPGDDPPGSQYKEMSGTSMAAPLVSAVAAMMRVVNPRLPAERIRQILGESARDLGTPGRNEQFGFGLVDAGAAVLRAAGEGSASLRMSVSSAGGADGAFVPSREDLRWNSEGLSRVALVPAGEVLQDSQKLEELTRELSERRGIVFDPPGGSILRGEVPLGEEGESLLEYLNAHPLVEIAFQDERIRVSP
ncbi:S8 family serine peptidase [Alkalispirochaeta alkalica]|uniref:S8 family serine peptidase n=1 Tax=Alkalispirochaeta alkalica TaxID=46356 RepID=UPI0003A8344F|nr:S8 family serine peptidase [Alkalispirochaeta alkalica]